MPRFAASILALTLVTATGCVEETVVMDGWSGLRELSDKPSDGPRERSGIDRNQGWAILLADFEGDNAYDHAKAMAERLKRQSALADVWVKPLSNTAARVYQGQYSDPFAPLALTDLHMARSTRFQGRYPFKYASLQELQPALESAGGDENLANHSGRLSLQIAYFDSEERMQQAQEYVETLRSQGVQAFYYHGPNLSMVTVGLFDPTDSQQRRTQSPNGTEIIQLQYSQRVRALQRQFPHNVHNPLYPGQPETGAQESFLVPAP